MCHALVPGAPLEHPTPAQGAALGAFLRALHAVPLDGADGAVARGLPDAATTHSWRDAAFARFEADVLPRLRRRAPYDALLDRLRAAPAGALVHGDLRPEHVRVDGVGLGVIDRGSARTADPAKDLVWPLLGTPPDVTAAVAAAYGGADLVDRARDWRDVGPCYAAVHGLDTGDAALVDASLAALAARAPR